MSTEERYGRTSLLRRRATSIGSNIAEGCGRGTGANFARSLNTLRLPPLIQTLRADG